VAGNAGGSALATAVRQREEAVEAGAAGQGVCQPEVWQGPGWQFHDRGHKGSAGG
jgi:hypothetical protein